MKVGDTCFKSFLHSSNLFNLFTSLVISFFISKSVLVNNIGIGFKGLIVESADGTSSDKGVIPITIGTDVTL